jgi:hypothetical protein
MPVYTPGVVPTAQYPTWAASIYLDRADGQSPVSDSFTVPANAKQQLPVARPQTSIVVTVGGNARTVTESATPAVGTVGYDRTTGIYTFNAADIGGAAVVAYAPLQTVITAGRMMAIESELEFHQDTFTAGPELGSVADGELVQFSSTGGRDVEGSEIMATDVAQALEDVDDLLDARVNRTESSITVDAAGTTTITLAADSGNRFARIQANAGAGAYSRLVVLDEAGAQAGDEIDVRVNFAATTNPTISIYSDTTGGALLATAQGSGTIYSIGYRFRRSPSGWLPVSPIASDAATARAQLGLGTMATQAASAVAITGGSVLGAALRGLVITQTSGPRSLLASEAGALVINSSGDESILPTASGNAGVWFEFILTNPSGSSIVTSSTGFDDPEGVLSASNVYLASGSIGYMRVISNGSAWVVTRASSNIDNL